MNSSTKFALGAKAEVHKRLQLALGTASAMALLLGSAGIAQAQEQAGVSAANGGAGTEVVVTGSRIVRNGYASPTPTTVMGADEIAQTAQPNIFNAVAVLPVFTGNTITAGGNTGIGGGTGGLTALNLRGIGTNRTLVLFDGRRTVGSTTSGIVNISELPQDLISRVDVVTGGASAAYGSDAVGGVVNFVLNKTFTGLKADASYGLSTYGDDPQSKVSVSMGMPFAGGRGHFLASAEYENQAGIGYRWNRPWNTGWTVIQNSIGNTPAGQPQYQIVNNGGSTAMADGGLIAGGPLTGIAFGPGGAAYNFQYGYLGYAGTPSGANSMMGGGQWQTSSNWNAASLDGRVYRTTAYSRVSFDVTSHINAWMEGSYSENWNSQSAGTNYLNGNLTIQCDNAFLPANFAGPTGLCATATTNNKATPISQFLFGSNFASQPRGQFDLVNQRDLRRVAVGANGDFNAFNTDWKWNATVGYGVNQISNSVGNNMILPFYYQAIDAVRAPNGQIVCRSSLTNPKNGCVPLDIIGTGVSTTAGLNYVMGTSTLDQTMYQETAGIDFSGDPIRDWAGPISVAFGGEYRREGIWGSTDCLSSGNCGDTSGVFGGAGTNYRSGFGSAVSGDFNVAEGFFETVIPLARDLPFAKAIDLNGAVRVTNYSTAGTVTTWKVGGTWTPVDDIKVRGTVSHDIRAPNLGELFVPISISGNSVIDDFPGPNQGKNFQIRRFSTGNTGLTPEVADNYGAGVVLQPHWVPGFAASVDYWATNISNGIGSPSSQQIVDLCFNGATQFCSGIGRNAAGAIVSITAGPFNVSSEKIYGVDYEASYRTRLDTWNQDWKGDVTLRFLATNTISDISNTGFIGAIPTQGAGVPARPHWKLTISQTYNVANTVVGFTERFISAGVYNNAWIQCAPGSCPVATSLHPTIANDVVPAVTYVDFNISHKFRTKADNGKDLEVYGRIDNLLNQYPPIVASNGNNPFTLASTSLGTYDGIGRYFRVGIRYAF